jgi:hypothetical protein
MKMMLFALILTIGVGVVDTVHAASSGLSVSPTSADVTVAPGSSYKGEMSVINQGETDTGYTVYPTPYSVSGEAYQPYFSPISGATDITKWFTLGSTNGTLKMGDQATIPFTITVPQGTGAGSYYATIFAETADKGNAGVITHKRVGMIVYLRVSGQAIEKGSIDTWNVPWLQEAPFGATVKIANQGSVHFQAKVHVVVSDLFGAPKFSYERSPEILPQKLRAIPVAWPDGASFGLFKVSGDVTYLGRTETLPFQIVFIASMPMRLLIGGLLLAFVAMMVFLGRKRVATHKK